MKVENLSKDCPQRIAYTKITIGNIEVYVSTIDLTKARNNANPDIARFLLLVDAYILNAKEKYETAIAIPTNKDNKDFDIIIVEGYYHLSDAIKGHEKWVKRILEGQTRFEDFRDGYVAEIPKLHHGDGVWVGKQE